MQTIGPQTRGCAGRVFSDLEELTGPAWVNILQWSQTCNLPPALGQESFLCGLDIKQLIEIIFPAVLLGAVFRAGVYPVYLLSVIYVERDAFQGWRLWS